MKNPFADLTSRVRRAVEAFYGDGLSDDPDYEPGFRRLTGKKTKRDLDPLAQDQMLRVCRYLYDAQPLAAWLVDMPVDLILGDELGYSVELDAERLEISGDDKTALENDIKRVLDRFWQHPNFNIRLRADELFTAYRLDGELCLAIAAENEIDGVPGLDYIDATLIKSVDPIEGSSLAAGVVQLRDTSSGQPGPRLAVVRLNPTAQRLEGQVFYWGNSNLPNAMRGRSELLRVADWIDSLDQFLFARADRATLMNHFLYDVSLKGASTAQVKARGAEIRKNPPPPASHNVHNDSETWTAITPDLKSEDATAEVKTQLNYILGSKSIPSSWYADGGDATRTTAGEQNVIALQALKRTRKRALMIFGTLLDYAYDRLQAKQGGKFPNRLEGGVRLVPDLPPIDEKDVARLGGVVQNIEAALDSAVMNERISARTARKVFGHVVNLLGVPVDPDDEKRQIDAEEGDREAKRVDAANQALRTALQAVPRPDEREPNPADPPDPKADDAAA